MILYKIRHKVTGQWKLAGRSSTWRSVWSKKGKGGKTWSGIGALKLHLSLFKDWRTGEFSDATLQEMENWEIVAIELLGTEAETHTLSIHSLYKEKP